MHTETWRFSVFRRSRNINLGSNKFPFEARTFHSILVPSIIREKLKINSQTSDWGDGFENRRRSPGGQNGAELDAETREKREFGWRNGINTLIILIEVYSLLQSWSCAKSVEEKNRMQLASSKYVLVCFLVTIVSKRKEHRWPTTGSCPVTNYSQSTFMRTVTNSVFALIQYCPDWSSNEAVPNDCRLTKTDGNTDHLKPEGCGAAPLRSSRLLEASSGPSVGECIQPCNTHPPRYAKPSNGAIEAILDRTGSPITGVIN